MSSILVRFVRRGLWGAEVDKKREERAKHRKEEARSFEHQMRLAIDPAYARDYEVQQERERLAAEQRKVAEFRASVEKALYEGVTDDRTDRNGKKITEKSLGTLSVIEWVSKVVGYFGSKVEQSRTGLINITPGPDGFDVLAAYYFTFSAPSLGGSKVRLRVMIKGNTTTSQLTPLIFNFTSTEPGLVPDPTNPDEVLEDLSWGELRDIPSFTGKIAAMAQKAY